MKKNILKKNEKYFADAIEHEAWQFTLDIHIQYRNNLVSNIAVCNLTKCNMGGDIKFKRFSNQISWPTKPFAYNVHGSVILSARARDCIREGGGVVRDLSFLRDFG